MRPQRNDSLITRRQLHPPAINPKLETLDALPRSAECLCHFILSTEFWISPKGRLRQWIALNVCLAAWLLIPTIMLVPIISVALHEVDGLLSTLISIVLKVLLLTALVSVAILALKHFPSSAPSSSRRRK